MAKIGRKRPIHADYSENKLPDYESEGRRFESCRALHFEIRTATMVAVFFVFGGVAASAVY